MIRAHISNAKLIDLINDPWMIHLEDFDTLAECLAELLWWRQDSER